MRKFIRAGALIAAAAICLSATQLPASAAQSQRFELKTSLEESTALQTQPGDLALSELQTAVLPEEDKPAALSERVFSENDHVNRLYSQEDSLNTVMFQDADGQKTLYAFDYPVKYIDESGGVQDKSNDLEGVENGSEYAADYQYVTKDNDIKTYFPRELSNGCGPALEYDGIRIETTPIPVKAEQPADGAESEPEAVTVESEPEAVAVESAESTAAGERAQSGDLSLSSALSEPAGSALKQQIGQSNVSAAAKLTSEKLGHVDRDFVEYKNVFGENTSVKYTPDFEGFKEDIILNSKPDGNRFSFVVQTSGLKLAMLNGSCNFTDPVSGEIKAALGDISVYEMEKAPGIAGEEPPAGNALAGENEYSHHYEIKQLRENEAYEVTIVADSEYLADEDTSYPVVIDPTIKIQHTNSEASTSVTDTMLAKNRPTVNFRKTDRMYIGNYNKRFPNQTNNGRCRMLVGFPTIRTLLSSAGVSYSNITDAQLYIKDIGSQSDQVTVKAYKLTNNWSVLNANANNAWDLRGALLSSQVIKQNNGKNSDGSINYWYHFNLLPVIKDAAASGSMKGTMLCAANTDDKAKVFASSQYASVSARPYLKLTYDIKVSAVSLNRTYAEMDIGDTLKLSHTISPSNAVNKSVTYTSSNQGVAYVDPIGNILASSPGIAAITARANDGSGKTATCNVKVYNTMYKSSVYKVECAGKSKYLDVVQKSVENNAPVCIYNWSNRSHQIWNFQIQTLGYYKISPQHTKDRVLGINSAGKAVCMADTNDNRTVWRVKRISGNRFSICSKYNTSLYLTIDSSNILTTTGSANASGWNINEYVNDSYWDGNYSWGTDLSNVGYAIDSNVIFDRTLTLGIYKEAVERWNNRSEKVHLKYVPEGASSDKRKMITIMDGLNVLYTPKTSNDSPLGMTVPKINGFSGEADLNSNWDSSIIYLNIPQLLNMTNGQLSAVITHEVGHALKMTHCVEIDAQNNTSRQPEYKSSFPAIMQPIAGGISGDDYVKAQEHQCAWNLTHFDTAALVAKWGGKK